MEKNALGAMENHKKGIVLIIKPIKKALLYAVGIIEFAMILFYINASTLKEILIEFGISLVVIFLVILHTGETVILDEKGCCLVWFNGLLKKKYKWEQLKTKRILYKADRREALGYEAKKCVLLTKRKINNKSVWNNPFVQTEKYTTVEKGAEFVEQFPFLFRPLSIIYIYFAAEPEACKEDGCYYSVVDEKAFMEKMKEWHIELEDNKPEERPPWKEQI